MSKDSKVKGSERKRRIEQEKRKESFAGFAIVTAIVVVLIGAAWFFVVSPILSAPLPSTTTTRAGTPGGDPTLTTCIGGDASLAEHIHVFLKILINGQEYGIPANIGITGACTRPVHTHDGTGEIHIESPVLYPYTLKDFFLVWGQPFDNTQILQYKVDSSHLLRMTVNGAASGEFQNYVFHDLDQVVIAYGPA